MEKNVFEKEITLSKKEAKILLKTWNKPKNINSTTGVSDYKEKVNIEDIKRNIFKREDQ